MNDSIPDRSDELLLTRIRRIRGLLRRSVVEARLSTLVAVTIPILLAMAMIDFLFRLPSPVRWMMLLAGAIGLGFEQHWLGEADAAPRSAAANPPAGDEARARPRSRAPSSEPPYP